MLFCGSQQFLSTFTRRAFYYVLISNIPFTFAIIECWAVWTRVNVCVYYSFCNVYFLFSRVFEHSCMGHWVIQLWILWETIVLTPLKRTLLAGNIYNFWRVTDIDFTRVHIAWKHGYPICFRNFSLYTFVWSCTSFFPDIPVFLFQLSSRSLFGLSNLIKILIQPFLRGWNVKNSTFLSFLFSPNFTKFQVYLFLRRFFNAIYCMQV